jgi:hypothetical protein
MRYFAKITTTFALALVFSAGIAFGQEHEAEIEQNANNNDATINQADGYATAYIGQDGNRNQAVVQQGDRSGGLATDSRLATISQIGNDNDAKIVQPFGGDSKKAKGEASQYQEGNRNFARIKQQSGPDMAEQVQKGNDNSARITQGFTGDQTASQRQEGNSNEAVASQIGSDLEATQEQYGNLNRSVIRQEGTNTKGDVASTFQDGVDNFAKVTQGGPKADGKTGGHSASVEQFGNQNSAVVDQFGGSHSASVFQNGLGNEATIIQTNGQ